VPADLFAVLKPFLKKVDRAVTKEKSFSCNKIDKDAE
jgi:hypothetical protein